MKTEKLFATKDYGLFVHVGKNRQLKPDAPKHRKLLATMTAYGYLKSFPLSCRLVRGKLTIKDGQHRLHFAEKLGLPVYYVIDDVDYNVAEINGTSQPWDTMDFAESGATSGNPDYQRAIDFSKETGITLATAAAMLAGYTAAGVDFRNNFQSGKFKITDEEWARTVVAVYRDMIALSSDLKGQRFLQACMAVCRVETFDSHRLLRGARRQREKLVGYSHRDGFLAMLEDVYNFGTRDKIGLKAAAVAAMATRKAEAA